LPETRYIGAPRRRAVHAARPSTVIVLPMVIALFIAQFLDPISTAYILYLLALAAIPGLVAGHRVGA
jgi:hypothetical protein